jgi:ABC-2 type transport system permease protein
MKFLRDVGLMFNRSVLNTMRNPIWLIFGLFQPLCFLLLFAPLLEKVSLNTPDFPMGGAMLTFIPGLLVMMALGAAFVGFHLIDDIRTGVIERYRVTPVSRLAPLLGRALRDTVILLIQCIIVMILAIPMGFKMHLAGGIFALILVTITGMTVALCSYALAVILKSEDALAPTLNFFWFPIQLLAGITLPIALAPLWLQRIAHINPFLHTVNAARALCGGNLTDTVVFIGFGVIMLCACAALYWASWVFKESE